jgi:thiol:disulfide interchange protein DsbD
MRFSLARRLAVVALCVVAAGSLVDPLATLPRAEAQADAPSPAPKRKDSGVRVRPREASFQTAVVPAEAKAGDTVEYRVTATVEPPWHIYAYAATQPDEGPQVTQFDLFDPAGLTPVGTWTPAEPPHQQPEPAFPDLPFVSYHEGSVTWTLKLQVPPGTAPGPRTIRSQILFMLCDDSGCKPPTYWTLPDAVLTVAPGGAEASAAIAPAPTAETPTTPPPPETATTPAAAPAARTDIEQRIDKGLLSFLLFAALGGLAALAMPCVWPMVPVTVNFFVKQGQSTGRSTTGLAITYCLAIIAIFTLIGVAFSAILGASSLQVLANNGWLNLFVAVMFLAFGLSLLGLFEIQLPSFLLNASAQGEGRGGLIGVIFMALTLTITSFTCTFPVVGGLLVLASRGSYLYPILGLMTFATVVALPFFLLALAPGLLQRMPRSGDWMNAVKVVGGLVEIGAAFKFLNTAELGFGTLPDDAWIDSQVMLAAWVALSIVSGIYLLGLFRTDHDHEAPRVGPIRLLTGVLFLFAALYISPALWGVPPQSRPYNRLVVGLLAKDYASDMNRLAARGGGNGGGPAQEMEVQATSTDPSRAEREEKVFHGVQWGLSLDQARETAKAEGRPILIDFTGVNCANCRQMEIEVLPRPEIVELLRQFVTVAQFTDSVPIGSLSPDSRIDLAEKNRDRQADMVGDVTTPLYVVLTPDGKAVASKGGYIPAAEYRSFLESALAKAKSGDAANANAGKDASPKPASVAASASN